MLLPLLALLPKITPTPLGVASCVFRQANSNQIEEFVGKHKIAHIEIHHDTLDLVNFCQSHNLSYSYHCRWDRPTQTHEQEIEKARKLIANGCSQITVHPESKTFPLLGGLEDFLSFENLDVTHQYYRKTHEFVQIFESFPDANLCLDLGHLWDNPREADQFVTILGDKISQVHLCQTDKITGRHLPTVDSEFCSWIERLLPKVNAKTIVIEPPADIRIDTVQ